MTIFCSMIAGLFCLHVQYPVQPELTVKVSTNGLGGEVLVQGNGWTAEQFSTDVLYRFDAKAPGTRRACVGESCVDFRRTCKDADGKLGCRYDVDTGLLSTFTVNAESPDAMQRAIHSIALYRGDRRQSDFPLTLLDDAAEKP